MINDLMTIAGSIICIFLGTMLIDRILDWYHLDS